jgi:hypothetical protein
MAKRFNNGSHYEKHPQAEELHNVAEHAHLTAGEHGQEEHLTGHEHSRQAQEHSQADHLQTQTATVGHGIAAFGHKEIEGLAFEIWQAKGCPAGTAEEDWYEAAKQLRARAHTN